jgi:hypothetical protein
MAYFLALAKEREIWHNALREKRSTDAIARVSAELAPPLSAGISKGPSMGTARRRAVPDDGPFLLDRHTGVYGAAEVRKTLKRNTWLKITKKLGRDAASHASAGKGLGAWLLALRNETDIRGVSFRFAAGPIVLLRRIMNLPTFA